MTKALEDPSGRRVAKRPSAAARVIRQVIHDAQTGRPVTVTGIGALKGSGFKLKRNVSLLKPIAGQAFKRRAGKHETA